MKKIVLVLCAVLAVSAPAAASADPQAVAVLNTEARWVQAIGARDAKALAQILAPNFVHVTYRGDIRFREQELAMVKRPKPYKQSTGYQTVDFYGNTAIVHGVNTITQNGKTVMWLRYTDVYAKHNGRWQAVSAQETQAQSNPEAAQNK
jgi:ketosteroid isomerase-like protein